MLTKSYFTKVVPILFWIVLSFSPTLLNAQTLELTATADKSDVLTGETFVYTFKYKCASTTTNCTNVVLTANIPSNAVFPNQTVGLPGDIQGYVISPDYKTITFTFKEPLTAGNTGIIAVTAQGEFGILDGSVATMTAVLSSGGSPGSTQTINTTIHSSNKFCPGFINSTGFGLDNPTTYTMRLISGSQNGYGSYGIGTQSPGPITVIDQFPAGTIIESVSTTAVDGYPLPVVPPNSCVIDHGNTKVTCTFPASVMKVQSGYHPIVEIKYTVKYPSSSFSAGNTVTTDVTVNYQPDGSGPLTLTNGSSRTFTDGPTYATPTTVTCNPGLSTSNVLLTPVSQLKLTKGYNQTVKPGQSYGYDFSFSNTGNTTLTDVVIEDIVPSGVISSQVNAGNFYNFVGDEVIKRYIKTVNNPTYTQITINTNYVIPTGDILTGVKYTFDKFPAGAYTLYMGISAKLDPNSPSTTFQNCLTGTASNAGFVLDPTSTLCATTTLVPADPYSTLVMYKTMSQYISNIYGTFYGGPINSGTTFWTILQPSTEAGGQPLQNPVVMDLLPLGLDYDSVGGIVFDPANSAPPADVTEIIPNFNGTGRTLVRFKWTNPWPAGNGATINISTKVNALAPAGLRSSYSYDDLYHAPYLSVGGIKNTAFFTGSSPRVCKIKSIYEPKNNWEAIDIYDLNSDGLTTTDTLCYASDYVGITSSAQMSSVKWVKGACDADYSKYPNFGQTIPGGLANYKLVVSNTGNVPTKDIQIVDILPWVGDAGVIDPQARLTEWRPNLVTPLQTPAGVVVYYSTEKNPCRTDYVASGPAGCTVTNWTTILPQDPTTIQSLKLDFGNKVLNPGDQVELTWEMRAPVNAPTNNEIAWNSFGFKATRADNNDPFLPSEPFKVGIKLKPNIPGNYGDYVWLDANKNGIQDNGEAGIDGVRVELYKDNGDGLNDPATDTRVAFTSSANGGLYLFSSIPVGDYYAVFFLPPGYNTSTVNATADDKDSDGILSTFNGNKVTIVPLTNIASGETDLTWDQGIFPDKAAVGNYVWFDENQNNVQDESSANGINGVKVCLYKSDNTLVATTNTTNDVYGRPGYYLFEDLEPGDYYIQFKPTPDKTYTPNTGAVGGASSDETDSDASSSTGKTATFTLSAGEVDLTWDAGLIIQTGPYKLGNFVWSDANNNGEFDVNEVGVNNVVVNLYNDTNNDNKPQPDEFVTTTLTGVAAGVNGIYVFDRLPAGNYIVQIPDQNFTSILKDYISSTGNDPNSDPDDNIENDDNGTLVAGCGVISKPITLGSNAEPLDAGKTNYTVDFGFYKCNKPNYAASVVQPTCSGGVGSISISGGTIGDKVGYTIGSVYTGSYAGATAISSLSSGVVVSNIAGSNNDVVYIVRIYNGEESCYQDFTFTISKLQCCNLSATVASTNVYCNDGADGTATLTVAGNLNPVTYLWSNGTTTKDLTAVVAGTYTVTVTETPTCTTTASITLTEPTTLILTCAKTDVTTNGGNNGTATVTATGGVTPYNYLWSNGETTITINTLTAGTYTVTVTDTNGCSDICSSQINEPGCNLTASASGTNVTCNAGTNGTATVTPSGNIGAVTYVWSNAATTANITSLTAGTYSVTVTETPTCKTTTSVTITEPTDITLACAKTDVTTNGGNNGTATVTATGGTSPYTYLWSNGATTASINTLSTGTFTVTVTDANGCSDICSSQVNEPGCNLTASASGTNVTCNASTNGTATVTASGNIAAVTYFWSNGATTAAITSLIAGTYTVTVTETPTCKTTTSVTITEPTDITLACAKTDVTTNGGNNGTATVTATDGTTPYSFLWSNGATTASINTLSAGTFTVTVTDANGCSDICSSQINEPGCNLTASATGTNVTCNAGTNGTATATPSGNIGAVTYVWSNAATTAAITSLIAGTYTVTVTETPTCKTTTSVIITEPTDITLACAKTDVTTNGGNNGTATVTATGGTTPYSFLWSNGATTASINTLSAGTFTVTVTDTNGCSDVCSSQINEPGCNLTASATGTNVTCNTGTNGTAIVTASGNIGAITYVWSNGATTVNITSLTAGTYSVTVTESPTCKTTTNVIITEPTDLTLACAKSDVTTNGGNDGTATVTATGGTTPYSFLWSNGATTASINTLSSGAFTVTVTDANGCSDICSSQINEPGCNLTATANSTNVTCNTGTNGTATVTPSGNIGAVTYVWSNGATTVNISTLSAGTYSVTVTETPTCKNTTSVNITEPTDITLACAKTDVTTNGGNDGTATVTATGGTTPYTYLWSNGATTSSINALSPGTFTVTVTDANGCSDICSSQINEPGCNLTATATSTNVTCNAGTNGAATVTPSGNIGAVTYVWSNGATTVNITSLTAGTYTVTVTETPTCKTTSTVTITEPSDITLACAKTDITTNGGNDGTATVTATGGTTPYSFLWSNGATTASINTLSSGTFTVTVTDTNGCSDICSSQINEPGCNLTANATSTNVTCNAGTNGAATVTPSGNIGAVTYVWSNTATTAAITSLISGTYTVTVTETPTCKTTTSVTITEPTDITLACAKTDVTTNGGNNGTASVTAIGGTTPYNYLWSNGATTANINTLSSGAFTVTVTDANGCSDICSSQINEPGCNLTATANSTNVTCNTGTNGTATVTPSGNIAAVTYVWSNGATTANITTLTAGTYSVTVTETPTCKTTTSVIITEPTDLTLACAKTDVTTNGGNNGTATVTVTGGTSPYTYLWSNGATTASINTLSSGAFTVTVTDTNGCSDICSSQINEPGCNLTANATSTNVNCNAGTNGAATATPRGNIGAVTYVWSNGATTANITSLTAGTYSVTVTETPTCKTTTRVIVTEPTDLTLTCAKTDVTTNGGNNGTAMVTATGGTSPYTYLWSNGVTTASINTLSSGTFTVTVTDANGCSDVCSSQINEPGCNLTATATSTNVTCNAGTNGTATVTPSGNIGAVTFVWSDGATTAAITSLIAGTYTVTVTETPTCKTTTNVIITEPTDLTLACAKSDVTTNGGNDCTATVTATGGTTPYTYLWSNGATTASINALSSGTFTVTVTDTNGCSDVCSSQINEPGCNLTASATGTNVTCNAGTNGAATVTPSGNIGAVTYFWSNGATTAAITSLISGTYTVTVTETPTCKTTTSVIITEPTDITLACAKTDVTTNGGSNGTATVTATGGTTPYNYLWSNGATTASINALSSGTFTVTVTDTNGCSDVCSSQINEPGCNLTASATGTNVTCNAGTNGAATVTPSGNIGAVTYFWSNGATTAAITSLIAGTYTVTVTETPTCTTTASVTITEPSDLTLACAKTDVTTTGGNDGTATVTATGGTSPYTYLWSNGSTTASITGLTAGTYTVTVTDANGCLDVCSSTIVEPGCTQPTVGTNTPTAGTCNGAIANDDAQIVFTSFANADKTDKVIGGTYNGAAYNVATLTVNSGTITVTGLKHNTQYTFRFWNGTNNCYIDITVTTPTKTCTQPCPSPSCGTVKVRKL